MFASRTDSRAHGYNHCLRRLSRFALRLLRALLIGAASFGPPRPPPEPPPPQTTEQCAESSLRVRDRGLGRSCRGRRIQAGRVRFPLHTSSMRLRRSSQPAPRPRPATDLAVRRPLVRLGRPCASD